MNFHLVDPAESLSFLRLASADALDIWSMCAACFCPCIPLSCANPLGRSLYQISEFPTEVPAHNADRGGGGGQLNRSFHLVDPAEALSFLRLASADAPAVH